MASSTLADIQTGHELGLAYLSDIPAGADTIAAGANIVITTVGTVKTIAATVPLQTITNGKNISVSYNAGTFTETITGVSYAVVPNYWDSDALTTLTASGTPVAFVSATTHTLFANVPTTNWTGVLQSTVDCLFPRIIVNTNTATAPQPISLTFGIYSGDLQAGNTNFGSTTISFQNFVATGTTNQWYCSGYWTPSFITSGGVSNPAVQCYASFTTADTTVVSVVLPIGTRFSVDLGVINSV